jgi:hypothetical protein
MESQRCGIIGRSGARSPSRNKVTPKLAREAITKLALAPQRACLERLFIAPSKPRPISDEIRSG